MNTKTMHNGISRISENEAKRKIFLVWNSTIEIKSRAPHHEFCPNVYKNAIKKKQLKHIFQ